MNRTVKNALSLLLCAALLMGLCAAAAAKEAVVPPAQRFNDNGKYTIVQFTDFQEGGTFSSIAKDFIRDYAARYKPDLFVLTGDNISSGSALSSIPAEERTRENALAAIRTAINNYMDVFDEVGIPVTMVFGNHDAESGYVSRYDEFQIYREHPSFIGTSPVAAPGAQNETASGNHYGTHAIDIQSSDSAETAFRLFMFDSGDYSSAGYGYVQPEQIAWYESIQTADPKPSIAFQHIVPLEVTDSLIEVSQDTEGARGATNGKYYILPEGSLGEMNEGVCPGRRTAGQAAALEAHGTQAVYFGHDHVNSYEVLSAGGLLYVNTPSASFGSYPDSGPNVRCRGARVITLDEATGLATSELVTYDAFYSEGPWAWFDILRYNMFIDMKTGATWIDIFTFAPLNWLFKALGLKGEGAWFVELF
ncbi:MAG: metallophosphoesterase [Oscillospiraceae bacterium]|nr:metallophosphoesterase [Oscillospiraceae bacterium]